MMIDQRQRQRRRRRPVDNNNGVVRTSAVVISLAALLLCVLYTVSNQNQIGDNSNSKSYHVANAFSILQSGSSMPLKSSLSTLSSSSSLSTVSMSNLSPRTAATSLFLFSLKNDNNGEDNTNSTNNDNENDNDEGTTTATIERATAVTADEDDNEGSDQKEDFTTWMEGLKLGTPLGKMASSSSSSQENQKVTATAAKEEEEETTTTRTQESISSVSLRDSSTSTSTSSNSSSKIAASNTGSETTTRRRKTKSNPLSNLIQFEAMLELAKIAGTTTKNDDSNSKNSDGGGGKDVFAVVDKLFKTFQKQQEAEQKIDRNELELLQLAQLEEKIIDDEATTVEDLMELERYVGGIPFQKAGNSRIWDTFWGKGATIDYDDDDDYDDENSNDDESDETNDETDKAQFLKSSAPASSSPLFRENEDDDDDDNARISASKTAISASKIAISKKNDTSTKLAQAAETILKDTTAKMEYLVAEASSAFWLSSYGSSNSNSTSTSSSSSSSALKALVVKASSVFNSTTVATTTGTTTTGKTVESISNEIVAAAQKIAKESGVDFNVQFAADRAREATEYAVGVAATANMVLGAGYAYGSRSGAAGMTGRDDDLNYLAATAATQTAGSVFSPQRGLIETATKAAVTQAPHQPPLFGDFASAERIEPYEYENVVFQGAEMGSLAGAIYEDAATRCHTIGHSLVANGTTANVAWMVTDSVMDGDRYASAYRHHDDEAGIKNESEDQDQENDDSAGTTSSRPAMIRTITIRGFDASDESVDREALLNEICTATSEPLDDATADRVVFHSGLLNIAKQIYADTKKYIDWVSPDHKIVLNGHSVGGSLSILMMLLITSERGVDYVQDRILRVYTHGCPPIATIVNNAIIESNDDDDGGDDKKYDGKQRCPILEVFDLPPSMIYGFIQPYDPVVRLFSGHDVLYPLVDDLGADGITLYSTGPIRSLRPITRAIFQAWNGWPQFRDTWKGTCNMKYQSVGIQHLLLPEPLRYLNDRFISVNVGVPPVEAIVRISPEELLPALDLTFPLDTFQVSLVPQAVRSFLHHFYPAYDSSISGYATKVRNEEKTSIE